MGISPLDSFVSDFEFYIRFVVSADMKESDRIDY